MTDTERDRPTRFSVAPLAAGCLLLAAILAAVLNPYFLTGANLENLARNAGFFAIFAIAQTFPILVRGLDLSQGGLVAAVTVVAALLAPEYGVTGAFVISVGLAAGVGLLQGYLVGGLGLSAFVVTLGGGSALAGAALLISKGQTIYEVPAGFSGLGWSEPLGVPLVGWTSVGLVSAAWWFLARTVAGRLVYATGSSPDAAAILGIPTRTVTTACYVVSATLTGVGALFLASRITSGSPVVGGDTALQAIAAAVVGGVSLFGGRGHPVGVFLGALALAVLANLLNLYNISSYWQAVLFGLIIILAASFDRLRSKR